ncbi:KAP family P-loop NTPase fold protein [Amycolatopsis sp. CA-126428]|uniref:KAP family P-loop NTPase fold protein n=1 Tax=Amycolatopsis sp. CA-126428 TaxID=2073158 RepID=UPI000CD22846|nr:KAP family NTPase [Amycolatopsis sp. CA-126428]
MDARFFADDPIKSNDADRIDRLSFAKQIATICEQVGMQSKTSVMALIGPWGSGKSSILELSKNVLEDRSENWTIVNYNPWLFSDIESLLQNYFNTLSSALPEKRGKVARKKLATYAEALSPLGKLTSLAGFDASGMTKKAAEILRGDNSIDKRKQDLEQALEDYDQKILVIIDDIDRLQPQELLLVFKLIRLIGRLPNIYYILAYDEHTVIDALQRSELVYESVERAHDYLEKIVQIRLDLPPLHDDHREALVDDGLESFFSQFNISISDSDKQRLGWIYHAYLKDDLREPRAINRFIAQLYAMYALVHDEVDVVDFLALTFMRTFEPALYRSVLLNREELVGRSLKLAAERLSSDDKKKKWEDRIAALNVSEQSRKRMLDLLVALFPDWFQNYNSGRASVQSVQNDDYFDRYFMFGVPSSDIPDSVVLKALAKMPEEESEELSLVVSSMQKNPSRVLRKISTFNSQKILENAPGVFAFLAHQYDQLPSRDSLLDMPEILLILVATDILEAFEDVEAVQLLQDAIDAADIKFVADLTLRAIKKSEETHRSFGWIEGIRPVLTQKFEQIASELGRRPMVEVYDLFPLLYRAAWLDGDSESLKGILWQNIEFGEWELVEVLGRLVAESIRSGGSRTIVELKEERIEELLGVERVISELGDLLDREDDNLDRDLNEALATKENKEAYAIAVMRRLKRKRSQSS